MNESTARWRRVEQICQDALDRPAAERAAFLLAACGEDALLRHEVEGLLMHEAAGSAFLESPTGAVAAAAMEPVSPRLSGHRVGVFDVGPLLGVGGMGEVYRARDTRLDRDVAIKILPEAFAHDAERVARFQREAKMLASLNHPHIAAIYGLEESAGLNLLVMELVEGHDLSQRIARGPIPIDEALADRDAGRRGARGRTRGRDHPSGSETREHQGARGRHGEGAGLRTGEGDGASRRVVARHRRSQRRR